MQAKNVYRMFLLVAFWFFGFINTTIAETEKFVCDKAGVKISVHRNEVGSIWSKPAGKDFDIMVPISWSGSITFLRNGKKYPMQVLGPDSSVVIGLVTKDRIKGRYDYVYFFPRSNKITIVSLFDDYSGPCK